VTVLISLQTEEWEQFQQDLLMTVRVANDFKAEAQSNLEKLLQENRSLRDKIRSLELEIDRIKCN
jgi:cell division protein FtsB